MPQEGDRVIFPDVGTFEDPASGNEVVGEVTETDTILDTEPREASGFGVKSDEGELGFDLADRGRTAASDLGSKPAGDEVTGMDVAIEPADRRQQGSDIDPQAIHNERSQTAQVADEAKDAEVTTNESLWASDPDSYDFPGVDTGPQFDETFDSDFDFF